MISALSEFGPHGWGVGPWWPLFPLLWFLLWAAVIVTAIVLWRRRHHPTRSAQAVLAEEFARGNITEEEYEQRLATLQRHNRT
jgi:putative membrane protein